MYPLNEAKGEFAVPRGIRRWSPAKCLAVGGLSLALTGLVVGATSAAATAQPGGGQPAGKGQGVHNWRSSVKGTVASTSTSPTTGFTVDVAGCSTPQFITTNGSTTYSEPGTGLTPTSVVAGEHVIVQLVRGASSLTAGRVTILLTQISGKVDSAGASQLLVTDQQGFERTVDLDVDGTTAYFPAGATVSSGDLVTAFGTVDPDHTALDAVAVHVRSARTSPPSTPPSSSNHVSGVVGSVTPGTSFVLDEAGGTTQTIATNTGTRYLATGAWSQQPTAVVSGEHVFVTLVSGASTATAKSVFILLAQLDGTVVSTSSTSFVLQDGQGFWRTVDVGGATTYSPSGTSLSGLTGDHVVAFGTVDPDLTDLDALYVDVVPSPASSWANTEPWKGVAPGCPVTPPASTASGTAGDPHSPGSAGPRTTGAGYSNRPPGQSSVPTGSSGWGTSGTTPANSSGPGHGSTDLQPNASPTGTRGSQPGGPGNFGQPGAGPSAGGRNGAGSAGGR